MKNFMKVNILVILGISLALLLNTGGSSIYGQIVGETNQTNQTNGQNNTQQLGQQLEQANQQLAQANQTQQQVSNQTQQQQQPTQANQTQQQPSNQSQQQDPKMNEKLLNLTNIAILALNDDNTSAAQDSLVLIQNALINASGKQVIIIPAPAIASSDGDDSD